MSASTLTTAGPTWSTRWVKSGKPVTICGAGADAGVADCAARSVDSRTAVVAVAVIATRNAVRTGVLRSRLCIGTGASTVL